MRPLTVVLFVVLLCLFDLAFNSGRNEERGSRSEDFAVCSEAQARDYCPRPPYIITTQTAGCYRVPTPEKPYCPFPQ